MVFSIRIAYLECCAHDSKTCARPPWRTVEIYACVLPNSFAYCFVLQHFGDEDGRDHIHTTVSSLRTDRQCGSPLGQMENTTTILLSMPVELSVDNRKRALLLRLARPAVQAGL